MTPTEPDTMDDVDTSPPEKRIGDRERREVDARLRQAHDDGVLTLGEYDERVAACWAARTRSELDALTRDLPDPRPESEPAPPAVRDSGTSVRKSSVGRAVGVTLVAVALLTGGRVIAADDATAIFSSRVVQATPQDPDIEVGVAFGSVEVVVPDDARVTTDGTLLFGSTDCDAACDGTGTRDVVVDARGAFGSVDIVRQSERNQDRQGRSARERCREGRRRAPSSTTASTARSSSPATPQHSGNTTSTASTTWNGNASCVTHSSTASQLFATSRSTSHIVEPSWCG